MAISEWKGDDNNYGVFFTHDKSYCLNKVLAIRILHEESAPDVFYSFWQTPSEEKVMTYYPYDDMESKPKKHHLLSENKRIKRDEIDSLFNGDWSEKTTITLDDVVQQIIGTIPKKRDRERTQIRLSTHENQLIITLCKYGKKRIESFLETSYTSKCGDLENKKIEAIVGTSAFVAVMGIFEDKSEVSFQFLHDKIKITGEYIKDERHTEVEIVLAQMKCQKGE